MVHSRGGEIGNRIGYCNSRSYTMIPHGIIAYNLVYTKVKRERGGKSDSYTYSVTALRYGLCVGLTL